MSGTNARHRFSSQIILFCETSAAVMEIISGKYGNSREKNLDIPKQKSVCGTIHQYSKGPLSDGDMIKLLEIAEDYRKVKNYVYARYAGIGRLSKLYPGIRFRMK